MNYSKTEFLDFSTPAIVSSENGIRLKIDGNLIRKVHETKFLGVPMDKDN